MLWNYIIDNWIFSHLCAGKKINKRRICVEIIWNLNKNSVPRPGNVSHQGTAELSMRCHHLRMYKVCCQCYLHHLHKTVVHLHIRMSFGIYLNSWGLCTSDGRSSCLSREYPQGPRGRQGPHTFGVLNRRVVPWSCVSRHSDKYIYNYIDIINMSSTKSMRHQ